MTIKEVPVETLLEWWGDNNESVVIENLASRHPAFSGMFILLGTRSIRLHIWACNRLSNMLMDDFISKRDSGKINLDDPIHNVDRAELVELWNDKEHAKVVDNLAKRHPAILVMFIVQGAQDKSLTAHDIKRCIALLMENYKSK